MVGSQVVVALLAACCLSSLSTAAPPPDDIATTTPAAVAATNTATTACDALGRGAKGNGKNDDSKHLQALLDDPACHEVVLNAGKTFLSGALHITRSNVVIKIDAGATLAGKSGSIKQCEKEADWRGWCAFVTVDSVKNVSLSGAGTLQGGGNKGEHWSSLHVRSTAGVQLGGGLRIHCTNSWWCSVSE